MFVLYNITRRIQLGTETSISCRYNHSYLLLIFFMLHVMLHIMPLKLDKLKVADGMEHEAAAITPANSNTVPKHCRT